MFCFVCFSFLNCLHVLSFVFLVLSILLKTENVHAGAHRFVDLHDFGRPFAEDINYGGRFIRERVKQAPQV